MTTVAVGVAVGICVGVAEGVVVGVSVKLGVGVAVAADLAVGVAVGVGVSGASTCTVMLPSRLHGPSSVTVALPAVSGSSVTESVPSGWLMNSCTVAPVSSASLRVPLSVVRVKGGGPLGSPSPWPRNRAPAPPENWKLMDESDISWRAHAAQIHALGVSAGEDVDGVAGTRGSPGRADGGVTVGVASTGACRVHVAIGLRRGRNGSQGRQSEKCEHKGALQGDRIAVEV